MEWTDLNLQMCFAVWCNIEIQKILKTLCLVIVSSTWKHIQEQLSTIVDKVQSTLINTIVSMIFIIEISLHL